ncbi:uridine kinase [Actinopolymorpha sp. B17G11]|uniref:uridine kinase n=1 Tax=unclassified Actinopolymorpha TaxID=2627063 RepID=UPI0032D99F17
MHVRPLTPDRLVAEVVDAIDDRPRDSWVRVLVDGSPPTRPREWAGALVDPLRTRGRPVVQVSAEDYLRPASLRFERGRDDPDVMYEDWLDTGALVREVFAPLAAGGTGRILPARHDAALDRAYRSEYVAVPPGGVVLVSGSLLLGCGLPADLSVHLALSPSALARGTPEEERWTLPAYGRYEVEAEPSRQADVVVLLDNPRHPALVECR